MIERWIEKNVEKLKTSDILEFAFKNGVSLSDEQAFYILNYLKTNWKEALTESDQVLVQKLYFLDEETKRKALQLLQFYRNKYKNFLS